MSYRIENRSVSITKAVVVYVCDGCEKEEEGYCMELRDGQRDVDPFVFAPKPWIDMYLADETSLSFCSWECVEAYALEKVVTRGK